MSARVKPTPPSPSSASSRTDMVVALTPEQDARAVTALARFKAKCAAWRAGVPLQQLDANAWVVDVDAGDAEVA
ncbi:hypothetical protein GCM10009788_38720 [Nocardioides humi]|uniref:Uncharacterized protein n=1 Tax=Nocardioides humi TaxID=449461 RepID=A0ABN2B3U3_9ACTN